MRNRGQVKSGNCFPGECHICSRTMPAHWDPFAQWLEDLGSKGVDTRKVLEEIWGGEDPKEVLYNIETTQDHHYEEPTPDAGCCVVL